MELIFATGNKNKVSEIQKQLGETYVLKSLKDIGCFDDIPETAPTFEGNAIQKANYVKNKYGLDCFSEDTGLEIEALDNKPGVLTARFGGTEKNDDKNMDKVLHLLKGKENRNARFVTVIALIVNGKTHTFKGICEGSIGFEKKGTMGFGYDPIFIPKGFNRTFAEMTMDEKRVLSHRGKAVKKLVSFLK